MKEIVFRTIYEPFRAFEPWPCEDDSLLRVEIGECAHYLPPGDPRTATEDGLVTFMKEAWRCIGPGGTLTFDVRPASSVVGVGDPLQFHFFNRLTFYRFARPLPDSSEVAEMWERTGWGLFGVDFGTRFDVLHITGDRPRSNRMTVIMEKPLVLE